MTACKSAEPTETQTASPMPTSTPKPATEVGIDLPEKPLIALPINPETATADEVQKYLERLTASGFSSQNQGVWMQAGDNLLANHQGSIPLPAASVTKVATSLVALARWTA